MRYTLFLPVLIIAFLSISCSSTASSPPEKAGEKLLIEGAWVRLVPELSANTAAYMRISNTSNTPIVLTGAVSDISKITEIHTVINDGDIMKMVHLESLEIPANSTVVLKPKNNHVMFMKLHEPLKDGQTVTFSLVTEIGELIEVNAVVKNP